MMHNCRSRHFASLKTVGFRVLSQVVVNQYILDTSVDMPHKVKKETIGEIISGSTTASVSLYLFPPFTSFQQKGDCDILEGNAAASGELYCGMVLESAWFGCFGQGICFHGGSSARLRERRVSICFGSSGRESLG